MVVELVPEVSQVTFSKFFLGKLSKFAAVRIRSAFFKTFCFQWCVCVQELSCLQGPVLWLDQRQHLLLPQTRHTVRKTHPETNGSL